MHLFTVMHPNKNSKMMMESISVEPVDLESQLPPSITAKQKTNKTKKTRPKKTKKQPTSYGKTLPLMCLVSDSVWTDG